MLPLIVGYGSGYDEGEDQDALQINRRGEGCTADAEEYAKKHCGGCAQDEGNDGGTDAA